MSSSTGSDPYLPHLRALAYRLTSTPVPDLPRFIPHLPGQLAPCKNILSSPHPPSSESAAIVHQLKTRTSSLIQDRSIEGRFVAVVLVKCLVDFGGWEILHTSGSWVRSLISILIRPNEPTTTKKLCMLAITRIFQLTHDHDELVREITTPNLPPFITATLTCIGRKEDQTWTAQQKDLLEGVLSSWAEIMPKHPTIFRPFITQTQRVIAPLVGFVDGAAVFTEAMSPGSKGAARKVHVLLHGSSTKTGALEDRDAGLAKALAASQVAAVGVFSALYGHDDFRVQGLRLNFKAVVNDSDSPPSMEELNALVTLLGAYIQTGSAKPVNIPLGTIVTFLQQLSSFSAQDSKFVSKLGKNLRQGILLDLATLHIAVLDSIDSILHRIRTVAMPFMRDLLEAVTNVFQAHKSDYELRIRVYQTVQMILNFIGYSMTIKSTRSLYPLMRQCCSDILPSKDTSASAEPTLKVKAVINPNALIGTSHNNQRNDSAFKDLQDAASNLLPVLMTVLPANGIPAVLRAEIERTAILSQNTMALEASVLNPADKVPSLLPFASQLDSGSPAIEAILRPRMPVIKAGNRDVDDDESQDDAEMEDADYEWTGGRGLNAEAGVNGSNVAPLDAPDEASSESTSGRSTPAKELDSSAKPNLHSAKHDLPEAPQPVSPIKRLRFEDAFSGQPSVATKLAAMDVHVPPSLEEVQAKVDILEDASSKTPSAIPQLPEDDDDDDDSDFEMPPLVLAGAED
ncbi:hypothetical protein BT63DRAFT_458549 [Microthyrium microscopicum]|uniref:Pre-rRNA-processing protein RIX1 n=1 Tax=Microthyrium microscopicum TaxID=703497 RepID=A0A6A6U1K8_9PEZI|nr:hypothetical protein BT63DRAFT_458549 [Microthyrium microscopicum]